MYVQNDVISIILDLSSRSSAKPRRAHTDLVVHRRSQSFKSIRKTVTVAVSVNGKP